MIQLLTFCHTVQQQQDGNFNLLYHQLGDCFDISFSSKHEFSLNQKKKTFSWVTFWPEMYVYKLKNLKNQSV